MVLNMIVVVWLSFLILLFYASVKLLKLGWLLVFFVQVLSQIDTYINIDYIIIFYEHISPTWPFLKCAYFKLS